jgi:putative endopeptidase
MKINVGYPDKWEDMEKYVNIDESKSLRANYDAIIPALRKAELEKNWKKTCRQDSSWHAILR